MTKCLIAKLLKNEIQDLNRLVESLEDKSRLCFPIEYDCTKCLRDVISNLRRIEKAARRALNSQNTRGVFQTLKTEG